MKVVYIPTLTEGICQWRIENYAIEMLKLHPEVSVHVNYMPGFQEGIAWDKICLGFDETSEKIQDRLESCFRIFDVVIFQKIQYKEALALLEKYKEMYPDVLVVAEVDDSVGHVGPSNPHFFQFADHHKWSAQHCVMSDAIIASTPYLGKSLEKFCDNIHISPNCINPETWKFKRVFKPKDDKMIRVGYVGAASHDEDLLIAYKGMLPLLDTNKYKFVIRYGGFRPKWLKKHRNIDFKRVSWRLDVYPQKLADLTLDLALAPLRDTEFNRCKSNLKWVEWSSIGVPLLASDVEPYRNTEGHIVLIENSTDAWTAGITTAYKVKGKKNLKKQCYKYHNITEEVRKLVDWLVAAKLRKTEVAV